MTSKYFKDQRVLMMKYAKMRDVNLKTRGQRKAAKRVQKAQTSRRGSQPKVKEVDENGWYGSEDYDSEGEDTETYYYYTDE